MLRLLWAPVLAALTLADGARIDVKCVDRVSVDTKLLLSAIHESAAGDRIAIHGKCTVNETIPLLGDRSYVGDSRSGTIITQADGANLVALAASDAFLYNWSYTGHPLEVQLLPA